MKMKMRKVRLTNPQIQTKTISTHSDQDQKVTRYAAQLIFYLQLKLSSFLELEIQRVSSEYEIKWDSEYQTPEYTWNIYFY